MLEQLRKELGKAGNEKRAKFVSGYFKTGKGEYGEGDLFLGLSVPETRKIAKKYKDMDMQDVQQLLKSKIHEERYCALEILCFKYDKADEKEKEIIFDFVLKNTDGINNWDLVDSTAPYIVGDFLLNKPELKNILYKLAKSDNLWERRIAIVSTLTFIKAKKFEDTIKISEILMKDKHDLIHKAVGWMLREMGKRDEKELIKFLDKYYKEMPRTMLRYSLERLNDRLKKEYMRK